MTEMAPQGRSPQRQISDLVAAVVVVVGAAVAAVVSVGYGLSGHNQAVGPGLFPTVLSVLLLVLGLIWTVEAWTGRTPRPDAEVVLPDRAGAIRIATISVTILTAALCFETLDFRLTIFLAPFVVMGVVFRQPIWRAAIVSAVISGVSFYSLTYGLGIPLPTMNF
ncbi:hypothetical protein BH11ACT6_BH11ACT6_22730 [soil metagenome]